MWLVLDIGNTSVKGGFFQNGFLTRTFRMASRSDASVPSYRHSIRHHVGDTEVLRVGIVSVVPAVYELVSEAVRLELMILPEVVGSAMTLPVKMAYRTPATLGMDRLAAAVGAHRRYGMDEHGQPHPVVVVDAGTAVTYDVVDARGAYRGGAIAPGPELARRSLARGTAQLPEFELELPSEPIGRSTREALQSGLMYGFLDAVSSMIDRMAAAVDGRPVCVATGGWGVFLGSQVKAIDFVVADLVLYGVHDLLETNPPGSVLKGGSGKPGS